MGGEIVTIQIGAQSNYLGTHFWNAQESYFTYDSQSISPINHDVHFREGLAPDGSTTYTPRTLIYDVKENFGSMRQENELYGRWDGQPPEAPLDISTIRLPQIRTHSYQQDLEKGVEPPIPSQQEASFKYWSDFNRIYYHPRSSIHIHSTSFGSMRENSAVAPTVNGHPPTTNRSSANPGRWEDGKSTFREEGGKEGIWDRDFRRFLEECDQMQGVVVLANTTDSWGGFACEYVEMLRDELDKSMISVWGVESSVRDNSGNPTLWKSNNILSTYHLLENASLYVPLCYKPIQRIPLYLSNLNLSRWQTSALQLGVFETVTLPTRLRDTLAYGGSLSDLEQFFTGISPRRKFLQADLKAEFTCDSPASESKHPDLGRSEAMDISFLNSCTSHSAETFYSQQLTIRGGHNLIFDRKNDTNVDTNARVQLFTHPLRFPQPSSYPRIFTLAPGHDPSRGTHGQDHESLQLSGSLATSNAVRHLLKQWSDEAPRLLGRDVGQEVKNEFETLYREYADGYESAEDDLITDEE